MSKGSKVFMVVPFKSSFIQGDISIIEKFHPLHLDMHNWADKKRVPLNMLTQSQFFTSSTSYREEPHS